MPSKNSIKKYEKNSIYHIYNRGVNKGDIFIDKKDYSVFLSYLKTYLEPKDESYLRTVLSDPNATLGEREKAKKNLNLNNFTDSIDLIAFCLMPNHIHLLVKQHLKYGINTFMKSLGTRYSMYFNKRHDRSGHLFQGRYKAVLVDTEEQLIYLSKYIHQNPQNIIKKGQSLFSYKYSSYTSYLGRQRIKWVKHQYILNSFSGNKYSYRDFVEKVIIDSESIKKLTID